LRKEKKEKRSSLAQLVNRTRPTLLPVHLNTLHHAIENDGTSRGDRTEKLHVSGRSSCCSRHIQFSGAIGSSKGKGVSYSLLEATDSTFSWIAALEEKDNAGRPIDQYSVDIDRVSRKIQNLMPISLAEAEVTT
jgi:hypothetical protein